MSAEVTEVTFSLQELEAYTHQATGNGAEAALDCFMVWLEDELARREIVERRAILEGMAVKIIKSLEVLQERPGYPLDDNDDEGEEWKRGEATS